MAVNCTITGLYAGADPEIISRGELGPELNIGSPFSPKNVECTTLKIYRGRPGYDSTKSAQKQGGGGGGPDPLDAPSSVCPCYIKWNLGACCLGVGTGAGGGDT